ncbi:MAG: peroxiredoxin [Candidatus Puniceispirillaceae bacterium]
MLTIGDTVPAIDIATYTARFSLAQHDGKKMVIFFFPRADTSGCTKESIQFSELIEDFAGTGTEVIGISKDTPQKQAKFRAKYDLKCHLGADHLRILRRVHIACTVAHCAPPSCSRRSSARRCCMGAP